MSAFDNSLCQVLHACIKMSITVVFIDNLYFQKLFKYLQITSSMPIRLPFGVRISIERQGDRVHPANGGPANAGGHGVDMVAEMRR